MAVLISCATGNFTTAGTWALVDSTSYNNSEAGNTTVTTSYLTSSTFTPGAITIDGIAVKLGQRIGTTGTVTVALDQATADVAGTVVTINCSDLPIATTATFEGGWILFKFAAPVTLAGATAYGVKVKTSSSSQVNLYVLAGNNWSRALRTTTTQAPVAGDDMIVMGEHTGAGTGNSFVVTMNETATTDYGSNTNSTVTPALSVCKRGTLSYGVAASTNYYLKLSGHLIVYNGGEFDIGTVGTEIPRNSTAVLEFDPAADGDMGLIARNGSTCTIQGLSRTSGKDIVSCKLNADAPTSTNLITTGITGTQGLPTATNVTVTTLTQLGPDGISLLADAVTDNVTNGFHAIITFTLGTVTNTTQVASVWLARGTGTNNRYVRIQYGNTGNAALTNGFFADVDLQAGTIGSCTAVGNGTATSSAITAIGSGYLCTIIGKASSGALSPIFGVQACNASGVASYAGDTTQNFLYYGPQVFTAAALPTTTLTVDTDTGWLSGDMIAVASTSRTSTDSEPNKLSSAATSTTLPCQSVLTGGGTIHSGTSPTQAEIILLTRNVKVRSSTPSIMAYVYLLAGSTANFKWAEFYYIGTQTATKKGIEVEVNTTGNTNASITFCSLHDGETSLLVITVNNSATLTNLIFSNNVTWLSNQVTAAGVVIIQSAITATNWTMDSNIVMRGSTGFSLADVGGTFTNNTVVGCGSAALSMAETAGVLGTWSGFTAHSCAGAGISFVSPGTNGTFTTITVWRNSPGVSVTSSIVDFIWDTLIAFGNVTNNVLISTQGSSMWFKNPTFNGDTSFSTTNGINVSVQHCLNITIDNGDFSTVSGIKTAHTTGDLNVGSGPADWHFVLRNTKLGAATEVASQSNLATTGFIASEKHDATAGNHKNWMKNGTLTTDTTFFNNASPSMRMTPLSSTLKLESAPQFQGVKVAVANGATASISAYIRKSAVGDGAAYNGNQPRLIQKANPALGQNSDVVLATYASATGSWNQISGTTSSATDDGCWEIVVDCDGTAGWINVDDLAAA